MAFKEYDFELTETAESFFAKIKVLLRYLIDTFEVLFFFTL